MSNAIEVRLAPVGDTPLPTAYLAGSNKDIPLIRWDGDATHCNLELALGNHPDPARYLHDLAVKLLVLADEVDAARPVPYVVAGGES